MFRLIWNSGFVVLLVRKPINTFFPWLNLRCSRDDIVPWQDGGQYDTSQYSVLDVYTSEFIQYLLKETEPYDSIFDIGCNQGRFLRSLSENGYNDLHGVDVMCNAINILNDYSRKNNKKIDAVCDSIQNYLPTLEDKSIDYFITYSATIELVHPKFSLFSELNRICKKGFIFAIDDSSHTYPRFYQLLALIHGFKKKKTFKLNDHLTVLHFTKK